MKAYGYLSGKIDTPENFLLAYKNATRRKKRRDEVKAFATHKDENLLQLQREFSKGTYKVSDYRYRTIHEKKKDRFLSMLPLRDHIFHWAMLQNFEDILERSYDRSTFACIKGLGQHAMVKKMSHDIKIEGSGELYYLSVDAHHMYQSIPIDIPKKNIRRKIKDPTVLMLWDRIIDSAAGTPMGNPDARRPTGVPIGLKISTVTANTTFALFDYDIRVCFGLSENKALAEFYCREYVIKYTKHAEAHDKGFGHFSNEELRKTFFENIRYIHLYYRFMDNIFVFHRDKIFLGMLAEWIGLYIGAELGMELNNNITVRPLKDGLTATGFRIFEDGFIKPLRANACEARNRILYGKNVLHLSDKSIYHALSSRLGQFKHCSDDKFLKKYFPNMDLSKRLSDKINKKKPVKNPFRDNSTKVKFESLLCDTVLHPDSEEPNYLIELLDYIIDNSVIEKNSDGSAKKRLVLEFKWLGSDTNELHTGCTYFAYSGSEVLIDQAQNCFNKEDLPAETIIKIFYNKFHKKFYKFT